MGEDLRERLILDVEQLRDRLLDVRRGDREAFEAHALQDLLLILGRVLQQVVVVALARGARVPGGLGAARLLARRLRCWLGHHARVCSTFERRALAPLVPTARAVGRQKRGKSADFGKTGS